MNKVFLTGRLTRDVEVRYLPSGSAVGKFSIATSRKYKKGEEWVEETAFIDCKGFGASVENIAKFFKKGSGIEIEGRLHLESWDDKKTGQKHYRLIVIVEQWEFPKGNKKEGDDDGRPPSTTTKSEPKPPPESPEEDDVPF